MTGLERGREHEGGQGRGQERKQGGGLLAALKLGVLARGSKLRIREEDGVEDERDEFFEELEALPSPDDLRGYEVLDLRSLHEIDVKYRLNGGSYAHIYFDEAEGRLRYDVVEPELDERLKCLLKQFKDIVYRVLDANFSEVEDKQAYLISKFEKILGEYDIKLTGAERRRLAYYLLRDLARYGKITPLIDDPHIEDVSCNGVDVPVYVYHRFFGSMRTNVKFESESELDSFIIKVAQRSGRHISIATPILEASLPEGSRVTLTLGKEVTMRGSTSSIRKFKIEPITPLDLMAFNSISAKMLAYLWILIEGGSSIIVAGEVATGKTTLLNAFSLFIPPDMKIISIEDTPEIQLPHENWVPCVTRTGFGASIIAGVSGVSGIVASRRRGEITMLDLLKSALRQRPDYIIVGEVRGEEASVLFQAIATGHLALTTMHANSPRAVIQRLQSPPMNIPKVMLDSLNCICMQVRTKYRGKVVRKTSQITEVVRYDEGRDDVVTHDVFLWDPKDDAFIFSGKSYLLERIARYAGVETPKMYEELARREEVLRWMSALGVNSYHEFSKIIAEYYINPERVLERMRSDEIG